jgi:YidC/Oxa1 family membrane protein insertase
VNEMGDQIRAVVFVVVALLILFAWGHFYKPPVAPPQPAQTTSQLATSQPPANTSASPGKPAQVSDAVAAATPAKIQAANEKLIAIESPLYVVEFSNRGGVVRSWKLKKYSDDQKPPHLLDLVNNAAAQQLGWPFSLVLSDAQLEAKANSALYEVTPDQPNLSAPGEVTFHWSDGHVDVTKKLIFGLNYEMAAEVSVLLDGNPIPAALAWRGGFGDRAVYKAASLVTVYYKLNDKLELLQYKKLGVSGNQSQPALQNGPMEYLGIEDQFFTAAFLPDGAQLSLWHWTQDHGIVDDGKPASEPIAEMAAGTTIAAPLRARLYVGPKDLKILEKTKPPLA